MESGEPRQDPPHRGVTRPPRVDGMTQEQPEPPDDSSARSEAPATS